MTPEKVRSALRECTQIILNEDGGVTPRRLDPEGFYGLEGQLKHALWMCNEAASWPDERVEKMMRWLGFVQGVLWARSIATIETLKKMNMPDEQKDPPTSDQELTLHQETD